VRIVINPSTGAMEFDATPDEAVALMRLQHQVGEARSNGSRGESEVTSAAIEAGLTEALYLAWDFLVQRENSKDGITVAAVARHLKVSRSAASSRLHKLLALGYVKRMSRGRYKAVCP